MSELLLRAVEAPPRGSAELPDIGGLIRRRPEDFEVEELPAYEADGRPGHLLVWLRKRSMTTQEALRELGRQLRLAHAEIGVAGLKDRDAVTRQQISVPDRAGPSIASFTHPNIELSDPRPHSHKLRRAHLRANCFRVVVRELPTQLEPGELADRVEAKLDHLRRWGLRNYYGAQRFGKQARNLEPGLAALAGKRRRRGKGDLTLSAGQSALFNLYLSVRATRGLTHRVLTGDILQKRASGGMFECEDPGVDQARLDAGELVITGPMFGSKTRAPRPGTASAELEAEILAEAGLTRAKLAKLGRSAPGTRRRLLIWPEQLQFAVAPAVEAEERALGAGVELRFCLPPGSYATVLLRELCG